MLRTNEFCAMQLIMKSSHLSGCLQLDEIGTVLYIFRQSLHRSTNYGIVD